MAAFLFACQTGSCTTLFFRTRSGVCPGCGEPGQRVAWALKMPRGRSPNGNP